MTATRKPVTRSPKGILSEKPIGLRLKPEERAQVKILAEARNRSLSSMVRLLVLHALGEVSESVTNTVVHDATLSACSSDRIRTTHVSSNTAVAGV